MERRRNGADGFLIAKGRKGMLIFWGQDRRDLSLRDRTSDVMDRLYKNANEAFFLDVRLRPMASRAGGDGQWPCWETNYKEGPCGASRVF